MKKSAQYLSTETKKNKIEPKKTVHLNTFDYQRAKSNDKG